jgi:uncharacterized membrane protein YhhN
VSAAPSAPALAWAAACALAALALVAGEWRRSLAVRWAAKLTASTAFVGFALALGAAASIPGRWLLLALALSWVGDALLLSSAKPSFLAGIAAFLLAHVAFAAGFAALPLSRPGLLAGAALMAVVGAATLRWLWPHLSAAFRGAVSAYVVAIAAMVAFAAGAGLATGRPILAVAALAFAASDLSVARDRFVAPGFVNRVWGLPLYYAAQLALALGVTAAAG